MKRQAKSHAWHHRHVHDPFVKQAEKAGYRARSAFKLIEINARDHLVRPGARVVDLGCAPGGWCQVVAERLKGQGLILGIDLLPMEPLEGVRFVLGDFADDGVLGQLLEALGQHPVDLVISDMAPNITGVAHADQARSYALAELAADFALRVLRPDGAFLVKVFQGAGFEDYFRLLQSHFKKVVTRKPKASRDESREVYLLAREPLGDAVSEAASAGSSDTIAGTGKIEYGGN